MKKIFSFIAILFASCMFFSCSSGGSKDIVLEDVRFEEGGGYFEIVPGTYQITWEFDNFGTNDDFYVGKIKVKVKVFKPVVWKERPNHGGFFRLTGLDATGHKKAVLSFYAGYGYFDFSKGNPNGGYNMDLVSNAIDALSQPEGTVTEIELGTATMPRGTLDNLTSIENFVVSFQIWDVEK